MSASRKDSRADAAVDPSYYRRIADILQRENDAQVKAIEQLEELLAQEVAARQAAEAALSTRDNLGDFSLAAPQDGSSIRPSNAPARHSHQTVSRPSSSSVKASRDSHTISVTKVAPLWVYKPSSERHDDSVSVIRGLRAHIDSLKGELRAREMERIKQQRESEAKVQDLQRLLNKKEAEISDLRRQLQELGRFR